MRGILINALEGNVSWVDIQDGDNPKELAELIGAKYIDGVRLGNGDTLYVDDEGLINGTAHGFYYEGRPYAGNGLILGITEWGEGTDCQTSELEVMLCLGPRWIDGGGD